MNTFARCLLVLAAAPLAAAPLAAAEPTKIVFIGKDRDHPYLTHEYMADCALLAKCVQQTDGVEASVHRGWPTDPEAIKGVKAIVLHTRLGGNVLFASPARRQAEALLQGGVGLVAIHWGTGADLGEPGELYLKALGGWYNNSFSKHPVRFSELRLADSSHPIGRGFESHKLLEEFYIDLKFLPAARPIVVAAVDKVDYPIGWAYERPENKGRSFGFVGGHFHNNLQTRPFRQLLVNAILWSAGLQIPAGGAPCHIAPDDLKVPPPTEGREKD